MTPAADGSRAGFNPLNSGATHSTPTPYRALRWKDFPGFNPLNSGATHSTPPRKGCVESEGCDLNSRNLRTSQQEALVEMRIVSIACRISQLYHLLTRFVASCAFAALSDYESRPIRRMTLLHRYLTPPPQNKFVHCRKKNKADISPRYLRFSLRIPLVHLYIYP